MGLMMAQVKKRTLQEIRIDKGLSQLQIAKALGMSQANISHWERDNGRIPLRKLFIYLELLEVDIYMVKWDFNEKIDYRKRYNHASIRK